MSCVKSIKNELFSNDVEQLMPYFSWDPPFKLNKIHVQYPILSPPLINRIKKIKKSGAVVFKFKKKACTNGALFMRFHPDLSKGVRGRNIIYIYIYIGVGNLGRGGHAVHAPSAWSVCS